MFLFFSFFLLLVFQLHSQFLDILFRFCFCFFFFSLFFSLGSFYWPIFKLNDLFLTMSNLLMNPSRAFQGSCRSVMLSFSFYFLRVSISPLLLSLFFFFPSLFLCYPPITACCLLFSHGWILHWSFRLFLLDFGHALQFVESQIFCFGCLVAKLVWLFCDPMNCSPQASLSVGFSQHEYWSGLPFPSPGNLNNPGVEPESPALQADSF